MRSADASMGLGAGDVDVGGSFGSAMAISIPGGGRFVKSKE